MMPIGRYVGDNLGTKNNFVISPGSIYYQEMDEDTATGVTSVTDNEVTYYDTNGFLYINPFLMVESIVLN